MASTHLTWDVDRIVSDMTGLGWLATDLARKAKLPDAAVHRFLKGKHQTPRVAAKLARALGHKTPRRYLLSSKAVA